MLIIDALRICLALAPLALYLLVIGSINFSRRPRLLSGGRDTGGLALALSGMVLVGPVELFFPEAAAVWFRPFAWGVLAGFYALCVVLATILLRPRLVIYNIGLDQLRPILANLALQLDANARWAGETLAMPNLGVVLHVENVALLRNVSLVAVGTQQNHQGWRRLETALEQALRSLKVQRNPHGAGMILTGLAMLILLGVYAWLRIGRG